MSAYDPVRRALTGVTLMVVATLLVSGCGIDPSNIPTPGNGSGGSTYRIHIEFANALNLPLRAPVMANGVEVGALTDVSLTDPTSTSAGEVRADIDIEQSVSLPSTTTAQLQQDTILGDIYIALELGPSGGAQIPPDGTIPIAQTEPALQVEDLLSGLATFVSGGAIQAAQDVVNRLNGVLPAKPAETQRISDVLKNDLIDVAAHQADLSAFLDAIDANTRMVLDNKVALNELLTPQGVVTVAAIINSLIRLIGVIGALGSIARALEWIAPLATAGNAAAGAFVPMVLNPGRPLNLSAPSNLTRLVALVRDELIPWAQRPQVDIMGVHLDPPPNESPVSTDDQVDQIVGVLRMIGMVR
ncbi:MlaD family protein [Rhodococcus sp. G-MC3]|uniref:MlaD family protein n=1 Tax=Rhodococcus sp. G-MC3 TaxID=3046209 RepID=UPI0024B8AA2E|nr:MlaD family protein [Rhodococcus sp. G-MC3]MDJ0392673.1 MlaD family protein [Rhodococcus sp. G-MC3]